MIFNNHPLFKKACKNKVDYDTELGDEKFMASAELSDEILADAKELFECMKEKANENNKSSGNT